MLYVTAVTAPGQDRWILAKFFFVAFMDRDGVEVQYLVLSTKQAWSIKDLLSWHLPRVRRSLCCGTQRVIPRGQDSAILPARVANQSTGFGLSSSHMIR